MKEQFLKLAKMKDEASFYRAFPTEEAFMAKYGKQLKKLQLSDTLQKANVGTTMQPIQGIQPYLAPRIDTQTLGGAPQMNYMTGVGLGSTPLDTKTFTDTSQPAKQKGVGLQSLINPAGKLLQGFDTLIQEKKQMKTADQWNQVSNLQLQAARMKPEDIEREYVRPEDSIISSGELSPQYYTKNGGKIKKANFGANVLDFANKGGSNLASNYIQKAYDFNAGSQIGSAVGDAVKFIPGVGPVVGAIAQPLLTAIGGAVDPYAKKIKKYTNQMNTNINNMAVMNGIGGVQQQYSGFMEDGGKVKDTKDKINYNTTKSIVVGYKGETPIFDVAWYRGNDRLLTPKKLVDSKGISYNPSQVEWLSDFYKNEAIKDSANNIIPIKTSNKLEDGGTIQSIAPERFINNLDQQLVPITPNNIYNPRLSFNRRGTTFRDEANEIDAQLTLLSQKKKLTNKDKAKLMELEDNKRLLFDYQEDTKTKKFRTGGNIRRNQFFETDKYTKSGELKKAFNPNDAKNDIPFQDWYNKNTLEGQSLIPYSEDLAYDYYSFYKNKGKGNIEDHFPDTYKRPNHPTFSNESIYSTPENPGGQWNGEKYNPKGKFEYAMGGDLQLYDGNAEVISNNPYSPEEGDTMMLKGPSHAEGGMDISYGGNPVEAEGGEPVMKGQDGDLTIFGNMKIGKELIPLLGDENAKGKKFKNYIADLSREEVKHNRLKDKSVMSMSDLKIETPLDKLKVNSFKYNTVGADSKLQNIAEKKQKASALQTAMLDTANEIGVDPDALSRGQIKKAKMGANIPKAENGDNLEKLSKQDYDYLSNLYRLATDGNPKIVENFQKEFHRIAPNRAKKVLSNYDVTNFGKAKGMTNEQLQSNEDGLFGKRTEQYIGLMDNLDNFDGDVSLERLKATPFVTPQASTTAKSSIQAQENNTNNLSRIDMLASALPYFRPTDAEQLNPRQLAGEMYALSTNQLEPVQAQQYSPELSSPYEISMQDSLNEITADKRSAERMSGYNPAAQSYIASQAYGAKSKVLADQMRVNQAMKDKTFGENRNLLNQAKLQNLQILDNQYTRQAQAKSNTKDINQAALSSIASKYQQNELERKTLQTYENMYNYRFGNNMRAQNWNGPALFNEPTVGSLKGSRGGEILPDGYEYIYDKNQQPIDVRKTPKSETAKQSNGGIVSAYRKL